MSFFDIGDAYQRRGSRRGARGGGPVLNPHIRTMLGAPEAVALFYGDYGVTRDGSNNTDALASRIGSAVVTGSGATRPVWGATSPTGRRGLTFTSASSQKLTETSSALAALLDGSQAYSALWVVKFATPTDGLQHLVWSCATAAGTDYIQEGLTATTAVDRRSRRDGAGITSVGGIAHSATIVCATSVYSGSAYTTRINGGASMTAQANTRAPTCTEFILGGFRSAGTYSSFLNGELYCLLLATTAWTTQQCQDQEAAAKAYWGTP